MRLCRFGEGRLGLVEGETVRDVTAALNVLPDYRYPLPTSDVFISNLERIRKRVTEISGTATTHSIADIQLLSPVANPGKIVGAPVNYQKHLDEVRASTELHHENQIAVIHRTGVFLKANSSLAGPSEGIALRNLDRRNDHEVELAFVIGKTANKVPRSEALNYVAGYSIGLDITTRGPEERSLRKSAESYTILGPWLVTADEIPDPQNLNLGIQVNGEVRQNSNTKYMILGVAELIEFATTFYTLYPGDVVITGTPEGVSPIKPGDQIVATIESIGSMEVKVRSA